jgi:hypothetical protein
MSAENVPAVVNIKTKGRLIAHQFSTGWTVGVVKSVEKRRVLLASFQSSVRQKRIDGCDCCGTDKLA